MAVTNFIWDELSDNVLIDADIDNSTEATYANIPAQFGEVISQKRDSVHYYNFDGQGSTRSLTAGDQAVVDTFDYTAFGGEVSRTGSSIVPFQYQGAYGYYHDNETANHYVRARNYQSSIGRWISTDPLQDTVDNGNAYRYVRNRPAILSDPSGLFAQCIGFSFDFGLQFGAGLHPQWAGKMCWDECQNFAIAVEKTVVQPGGEPVVLGLGGGVSIRFSKETAVLQHTCVEDMLGEFAEIEGDFSLGPVVGGGGIEGDVDDVVIDVGIGIGAGTPGGELIVMQTITTDLLVQKCINNECPCTCSAWSWLLTWATIDYIFILPAASACFRRLLRKIERSTEEPNRRCPEVERPARNADEYLRQAEAWCRRDCQRYVEYELDNDPSISPQEAQALHDRCVADCIEEKKCMRASKRYGY